MLRTLLVLGALSWAPVADAQEGSRERARELAEKAQDRLLEGSAKEALDLALQAEAEHHAPTILLLVARAQIALGLNLDAVRTYDRIIAEPVPPGAPPEFRDAQVKAEAERSELYAKVGVIEIEWVGSAEDAKLRVGGVDVPAGSGSHAVAPNVPVTVEASAPARSSVSEELRVAAGERRRVRVELVRRTEASAFDDVARTPAPTIAFFSLAGALGLTGAITGGLALERGAELDAKCSEKRCIKADRGLAEEAGRLADASTGTLVAAGVAASAGVVFLLLSEGGARWSEARVAPRLAPLYLGVEVTF